MSEFTMTGLLLVAFGQMLTVCGAHRASVVVSFTAVLLCFVGVLEAFL